MGTANERNLSLILCVAFCLMVSGLATYDLRSSFTQAKEKVHIQVSNTSFLIGEWIKGAFTASDYVLRDIVNEVPLSEVRYPIVDKKQHAYRSKYLEEKRLSLPNTILIGLFDSNCIVTHTNTIVGFNAQERKFCQDNLSEPHPETYISSSLRSNLGKLNVTQTRKLNEGVPGKYSGFAAVAVDLIFFEKWLNQVTVGPHGVLAIADEEVKLVARKPALPEMIGNKVNAPVIEAFVASGEPYKTFSQTSPLDGENRLYGVRRVDGMPFIIVVGEADRDWQASWLHRVWGISFTVIILWIMAFLILRSYWIGLKHLAEIKKVRDSLEKLSLTDPLTELANRRHFNDFLAEAYRRLRRINGPISVVMIDIDYFKTFNDTYGHQEGDKCLQMVAEVINKTVKRSQDLASRYGGEEFCCILPETSHEAAVSIAMSIRDGIAAMGIHHTGSTIADHVTVSLGVATKNCNGDISPESIVNLADKHLYWAKENGRNRVGSNASNLK